MSSVAFPPPPGETVVYKYGTGHAVPPGAVYLCTREETITTRVNEVTMDGTVEKTTKQNFLVWHYFRVPLQ